jgi:hypothetical protein
MSEKHEEQLGGMSAVGRNDFSADLHMPSTSTKAKTRRHERRKVKEVLHQIAVEEDLFGS